VLSCLSCRSCLNFSLQMISLPQRNHQYHQHKLNLLRSPLTQRIVSFSSFQLFIQESQLLRATEHLCLNGYYTLHAVSFQPQSNIPGHKSLENLFFSSLLSLMHFPIRMLFVHLISLLLKNRQNNKSSQSSVSKY